MFLKGKLKNGNLNNFEIFKKTCKYDPTKKLGLRWESKLRRHLRLILNQIQTSTHDEYFCSPNLLYQVGLFNQKTSSNKLTSYKNLGALGTGFFYAPVLLSELLPNDRL